MPDMETRGGWVVAALSRDGRVVVEGISWGWAMVAVKVKVKVKVHLWGALMG